MLPGLKRYLGIVILAIIAIVFGVLTLLDVHPVDKMFRLIIWALKDIRAVVAEIASVMHKQLNAIILITAGSVAVFVSGIKLKSCVEFMCPNLSVFCAFTVVAKLSSTPHAMANNLFIMNDDGFVILLIV